MGDNDKHFFIGVVFAVVMIGVGMTCAAMSYRADAQICFRQHCKWPDDYARRAINRTKPGAQ